MSGRDAESPCERAADGRVWKRLRLDGVSLEVRFTFAGRRCEVEVAAGKRLSKATYEEIERVIVRMLGFRSDCAGFERRAATEPDVARLIANRRGLRIPGAATPFEAVAWSIIGQQVNLAFAFRLRRVMIETAGRRTGAGTYHPTAADVAALDYTDLTSQQYSRRKAEYLIDTARLIVRGELPVGEFETMPPPVVREKLLAVRGIGEWSANYVMLRGCGFNDAVPVGDSGLRSALRRFYDLSEPPGNEQVADLMTRFAPHRSLATFHLWKSSGDPA